jgi:hypothetical protein
MNLLLFLYCFSLSFLIAVVSILKTFAFDFPYFQLLKDNYDEMEYNIC